MEKFSWQWILPKNQNDIRRWTWQWVDEALPLEPKELVDDWLERRERVNKIKL